MAAQKDPKQYYIKLNDELIPVSKEVYVWHNRWVANQRHYARRDGKCSHASYHFCDGECKDCPWWQDGFQMLPLSKVLDHTGELETADLDSTSPAMDEIVADRIRLGYGGSVGALQAMGALEMGLSEEELKPLVDAWRASNPNIVQLWWEVDRAVKTCVMQRIQTVVHGIRFTYESGFLFIALPSGRRLAYVKPRIDVNRFGGEAVTYEGIGCTKKWERLESYGPKFVENCIAEDTLVVTDCGPVPIQSITRQHRIWDGVEFVQHDGLITQGVQSTIDVNGIQMTEEHKILTTKGWMECGKATGFEWENVSLPDGFISRRECEERKTAVAVPLCLWKNKGDFCQGSYKKTISSKICVC